MGLSLSLAHALRKMLTAGNDGTLNVWDVRPVGSTANSSVGGNTAGLSSHWEDIINNPSLVSEMRDYFLYSQV